MYAEAGLQHLHEPITGHAIVKAKVKRNAGKENIRRLIAPKLERAAEILSNRSITVSGGYNNDSVSMPESCKNDKHLGCRLRRISGSSGTFTNLLTIENTLWLHPYYEIQDSRTNRGYQLPKILDTTSKSQASPEDAQIRLSLWAAQRLIDIDEGTSNHYTHTDGSPSAYLPMLYAAARRFGMDSEDIIDWVEANPDHEMTATYHRSKGHRYRNRSWLGTDIRRVWKNQDGFNDRQGSGKSRLTNRQLTFLQIHIKGFARSKNVRNIDKFTRDAVDLVKLFIEYVNSQNRTLIGMGISQVQEYLEITRKNASLILESLAYSKFLTLITKGIHHFKVSDFEVNLWVESNLGTNSENLDPTTEGNLSIHNPVNECLFINPSTPHICISSSSISSDHDFWVQFRYSELLKTLEPVRGTPSTAPRSLTEPLQPSTSHQVQGTTL